MIITFSSPNLLIHQKRSTIIFFFNTLIVFITACICIFLKSSFTFILIFSLPFYPMLSNVLLLLYGFLSLQNHKDINNRVRYKNVFRMFSRGSELASFKEWTRKNVISNKIKIKTIEPLLITTHINAQLTLNRYILPTMYLTDLNFLGFVSTTFYSTITFLSSPKPGYPSFEAN